MLQVQVVSPSSYNRFYIYSAKLFLCEFVSTNWKFPLLVSSQLTFLKGVLVKAGHKISAKAGEDLNLRPGEVQ